ncbi:MAG: hypothetical protein IJV85_05920 [Clostridia bacterium]|nr:hypothetical protein [Clostridia bacterium]
MTNSIEKSEFTATRTKIYHGISITLITISLLFTVFRFQPVALRVVQSIKDLGLSIAYYCMGIIDKHELIHPTVTELPSGMTTILPTTGSEFRAWLKSYGNLFIDGDNISKYFSAIGDGLYNVLYTLLILSLPGIALGVVVYLKYSEVDTDHNRKSGPLRAWMKMEDIFYYPAKGFIKDYLTFFTRDVRAYFISFCWIWAWNLNVITITLEAAAFVFYLPFSMDFANLFVQASKLVIDASIAVDFIPGIGWLIIGWLIFDHWRREMGFSRLEDDEEKNKDFLIEHPGNLLATGPPRVGKTQAITDMALSQNIIFREVAKKKSFDRSMEFPQFSWSVLEQSIIKMRKQIPVFCLAFIREWIPMMASHFFGRAIYLPEVQKGQLDKLKRLGYTGNDFIFDYDHERYGLTFNDQLRIVKLFDCIELYAEEFYIYTAPTPLLVGNYPIRTDIRWEDYGNYPLMDADFFRRDPAEVEKYSQYIHALYFDMTRLGKKKDPDGRYINNLELGAEIISEMGKEYGNQITNRGQKADADECNATNDLSAVDGKMRSHGTTIDYETYFRILGDEQRAASLQADIKELGSEMKISRKKPVKIKMPFFAFGELLYAVSTEIMKKLSDFFKSRHGSKGLAYYLALRIYSLIYNHYIRIYNQFSSYEIELKLIEFSQGETLEEAQACKYYISTKKVRSDVYDTGFFGVVYRKKFASSETGGINQVPQYTSKMPSIEMMQEAGSHFYDKVFKYFDVKVWNKNWKPAKVTIKNIPSQEKRAA